MAEPRTNNPITPDDWRAAITLMDLAEKPRNITFNPMAQYRKHKDDYNMKNSRKSTDFQKDPALFSKNLSIPRSERELGEPPTGEQLRRQMQEMRQYDQQRGYPSWGGKKRKTKKRSKKTSKKRKSMKKHSKK